MIDYEAARPVYLQLADILRQRIEAGQITRRLPSEPQLVQEFGVARETARKAVKALEAEGLVEVIHGRGAFVREQR